MLSGTKPVKENRHACALLIVEDEPNLGRQLRSTLEGPAMPSTCDRRRGRPFLGSTEI
jgi:hypothetical protein